MYTKLVTAAFALTLAASGTAHAEDYNEAKAAKAEEIMEYIAQFKALNPTAREQRAEIANELEKLGQCYGKTGQPASDYTWHPCENGSIHFDGSIGKTSSQMTLKQEHEAKVQEATEVLKLIGFCKGYFDVNSKASEALELGGSVSREEARHFLTSLPFGTMMASSHIGQVFLAMTFTGLEIIEPSQAADLIAQGNKEGARAGNRDYEKNVVYKHYKECLFLIKGL